MKHRQAEGLPAIDIAAIESKLTPKVRRSHHEVVKIRDVNKDFLVGHTKLHILKNISATLYSGEFVIIYGPSGCGKSTLLHSILGLEPPTTGHIFLRDHDLYSMTNDERTNFRREKIGMVFQQSNWIKSLTVLENVAYPLFLSGVEYPEALKKAQKMLIEVEMGEYAKQRPTELSGGQQQRIAMGRALMTDPWILIADEPTGNLDTQASADIMHLLATLNRVKRRMIIMVTHEMQFLPIATRRIGMKDGEVLYDEHD